ncbi:MAG: PilZ domain-containing protein [Sedimentisphaerales bacterium]|nr:PilZ domain-containing protein [Sedimentisphaerales bacterium]
MNNKVIMLRGDEPEKILRTAIDNQIVAIMSYLSRGKWHVAKVLMSELAGNRIIIESAVPKNKQHPLNILANQPVGMSFKYEYGKFVFDTTVVALEAPSSGDVNEGWGGKIILAVPDRIEVVQRRSYFRVNVPRSLHVKVVMWHRGNRRRAKKQIQEGTDVPGTAGGETSHNYCRGRLIDISAGGAQVIIPCPSEESAEIPVRDGRVEISRTVSADGLDFRKGQFIGLRFTPMPYEMPIMISAQIRNILPTSDGNSTSVGLQIVGLEASREGREILSRLIDIVEKYYQINQSGVRGQDIQLAYKI